MEEEVDRERLSKTFEETVKHFNEAFDISRYLILIMIMVITR